MVSLQKQVSLPMKKNKVKIVFDILEKEMETLSFEHQLTILGGNSTGGYYSDGYWGYVNGEYVYTYQGGVIEEVVITLKGPGTGGSGATGGSGTGIGEGYSAYDIVSKMLTSMGATATHADVNATILNLESKGFGLASKGFGIVGLAFNANDWLQDPNWQDAGQIGLGVVAIGAGGWIALGAGVVLAGWELYEVYEESKSTGSSGGSSGSSGGGF